MLQGFVTWTCSRDQITELAHLWKSCWDVFQGHVAATYPLVCAGTFSLAQLEICAKFAPATCPMKFNKLNSLRHVAPKLRQNQPILLQCYYHNNINSENKHISLGLAQWEVYSVKWKGGKQKNYTFNHSRDNWPLDRQNRQTKRKAQLKINQFL